MTDSSTHQTVTITNGRGLEYEITLHRPTPGRPWNGFSLGQSQILPMSDIPFVVQGLMDVYVGMIQAVQNLKDAAEAMAEGNGD